ncbi:MAG: undecaprenyl-diphosphatase [Candidatus Sericytochromatia bacterium]|nr:MAG: undecaprenyl-diphosphatase [Candidatus Sericytochromatia bacterium]
MNIIESIILGIVQGLTEFLPISSSAHLLIFPKIMGWQEPPFVFDTSLHLGTLISLLVYFRTDIITLLSNFFKCLKKKSFQNNNDGKLALYILIGTIPAGLFGLFFEKTIEEKLHNPKVIVFTLFFLGILLLISDYYSKKNRNFDNLNFKDIIIIGFAQAMALIPGTSRSGITMTSALFLNLNRETAARISFLLGIPITTAASLYKLKDLFEMKLDINIINYFTLGVISSAITGFLCIKYLLKFLKSNSFVIFAIYRIALSCFLLFLILKKIIA